MKQWRFAKGDINRRMMGGRWPDLQDASGMGALNQFQRTEAELEDDIKLAKGMLGGNVSQAELDKLWERLQRRNR